MQGVIRACVIIGVAIAFLTSTAAMQGVASGTVRGSVRTANGSAVAAARVVVGSRANSAYTGTATTDDTGNFTVADVPVGGVTLTVYNNEQLVVARGTGVIREAGETITVALQTP